MKLEGNVKIAIKSPDGSVREHTGKNVVFNIPKLLMEKQLGRLQEGNSIRNAAGNIVLNDYFDMNYLVVTELFKTIKVNDRECSTTNQKDFTWPVLAGGWDDKKTANNYKYTVRDLNLTTITGNIFKQVYTWNNVPAFQIKSINLAHKLVTSTVADCTGDNQGSYFKRSIKAFDRIYALVYRPNNTSSTSNNTYNAIYTEGAFNFSQNQKSLTKVLQVAYNNRGSRLYCAIYFLQNNEILLLRNVNNITADDTSSSWKYAIIIDAETFTVKRSFPLSQFENYSSTSSCALYYSTVVSDINRDVLLIDIGSSGVKSYILPRTSTEDTIVAAGQLSVDSTRGFFSYNNLVFNRTYPGQSLLPFEVNTDGTLTFLNNTEVLNWSITNVNQEGLFAQLALPDWCDNEVFTDSYPRWWNTTCYPVSPAVQVNEGDTLTVEYTITAN